MSIQCQVNWPFTHETGKKRMHSCLDPGEMLFLVPSTRGSYTAAQYVEHPGLGAATATIKWMKAFKCYLRRVLFSTVLGWCTEGQVVRDTSSCFHREMYFKAVPHHGNIWGVCHWINSSQVLSRTNRLQQNCVCDCVAVTTEALLRQ